MSKEIKFLCVSNFNTNHCVSIPFEHDENTNKFLLAQEILERLPKYLYIDEILSILNHLDAKEELLGMPFGYDGSYIAAYLHDNYVCIRPEWNLIECDNLTFKPIHYIKVNEKHYINELNLLPELIRSVRQDIVWRMCMEMKNKIGKDVYDKLDKVDKFDFETHIKKLTELFGESDDFEYDKYKINCGTFNSFEEFVSIFPQYKKYEVA